MSDPNAAIVTISFWPHFFAVFISVSYALLCFLCGLQVVRTICHRHELTSFRFAFLIICFIWTLLRVIFWCMVELHTWPIWASSSIYFLPSSCQIATFSLLVLYYAKHVHRSRGWRNVKKYFLSACLGANIIMFVLTVVFAGLFDRTAPDGGQHELLNKMYYVCSSIFFGILVGLASYYIHKLRKNRLAQETSKQEVLMNFLVFFIFLSRCIFDFMAAFDYPRNFWRHHVVETANGTKMLDGPTFGLVFIWEIVPTLMVISYFRTIPPTGSTLWGKMITRCRCCQIVEPFLCPSWCCCLTPDCLIWCGCYTDDIYSTSPAGSPSSHIDDDDEYDDDYDDGPFLDPSMLHSDGRFPVDDLRYYGLYYPHGNSQVFHDSFPSHNTSHHYYGYQDGDNIQGPISSSHPAGYSGYAGGYQGGYNGHSNNNTHMSSNTGHNVQSGGNVNNGGGGAQYRRGYDHHGSSTHESSNNNNNTSRGSNNNLIHHRNPHPQAGGNGGDISTGVNNVGNSSGNNQRAGHPNTMTASRGGHRGRGGGGGARAMHNSRRGGGAGNAVFTDPAIYDSDGWSPVNYGATSSHLRGASTQYTNGPQ